MAKQKHRTATQDSRDLFPGRNTPGTGDEGGDHPAPDAASGKSRTRKKRESTALQQRGEELAALSPAMWRQLPLPAELAEALSLWPGLKTHEARRRHMQYIGRLMRELDDPETLLCALDDLKAESGRGAARFARLERLRDALLDPEETARAAALKEALAELPLLREARLVHLVQGALAEREKKQPPRQARELFRYLRDGEGAG